MLARPKSTFLTLKETASLLGCSPRTLQRYQKQGRIRFVQRGRMKFCLQEDVDRLLGSDRIEVLSARLDAPDSPSHTARRWFAGWIEFRRELDRTDGVEIDYERLLGEVMQQLGTRKMSELTVGLLRGLLESLRNGAGGMYSPAVSWQLLLGTPTPVDFDLLAAMPPGMPLIEARRSLRRALGSFGAGFASAASPSASQGAGK